MSRKKIVVIWIISILLVTSLTYFVVESIKYKVKVGIVDSGVSITELGVKDQKSFVTVEYGYPETEKAFDLYGHGTQVYRVLTNSVPNNVGTEIYSAKITDRYGNVQRRALIDAVNWLANSVKVDVISMSLGGNPLNFPEYHTLFKDLADRGIIMIAAAGNLGSSEIIEHGSGEQPAILPWIIGVGAIDGHGSLTSFSSVGQSFYHTYPGEVVEYGKSYDSNSWGTSYSVPRITAKVTALLFHAHNKGIKLNVNSVGAILARSTGNNFDSKIGFGVPNLSEMLNLLDSDPFIMIYGGDEETIGENYNRFINESFTITYQVRSFGDVSNSDLLYMYGINESSLVDISIDYKITPKLKDPFNQTINFEFTPHSSGLYQFKLCYSFEEVCSGNLIENSLTVLGNPEHYMLIDLESLVDARFYEYGALTDFTYDIRSNMVQTDIGYSINQTDLSKYEVVYSPLILDRQYTDVEYLLDYVSQGGTWFVSLGLYNRNNDHFGLLSRFNIEIIDLLGYMNGRNVFIPNNTTEFTQTVHYSGVGLTTSSNYTSMGEISIFGDGPEETSGGYIIKYGAGTIYFYGSTDSFTNQGLVKSNSQNLLNSLVDL